MAAHRDRKQSQFLVELDKYYDERQKYSDSFVDTPCPQNFIPGMTKAKSDMKVVRTVSRKLSSICYRGVVVQVKDNMTALEKGVIPGGLVAIAFPSPSQHASCLEHKMEQIYQRHSKLSSSNSTNPEEGAVDEEIQKEEDELLLENMCPKQRSCSLPTTRKDIAALPIISYDEHCIVAEFGNIIDHKRDRRSSYPLAKADFEAHAPQPMRSRKYDKFEFDSATRLGALCRGMSYYGSLFDNSMPLHGKNKMKRKMPFRKAEETDQRFAGKSFNYSQPTMSNIEEIEPEFAREAEVSEQRDNDVVIEDVKEQNFSEKVFYSDPEDHTHSTKPKRSSGRLKTFKKRISRWKTKEDKDDSEIIRNTSKETLAQIQNVLRAKLPKTFQTTVKVGLSFDPVTMKERNDQAQGCRTPPKARPAMDRSRSLTSSPQLLRRNGQLNSVGNTTDVPSLIVSPPTGNGEVSGNEKAGLFVNFLKVGKDTLSRKIDRLSYRKRKNELRSASSPNVELFQSFSGRRARKLENLLGVEFSDLQSKERSNSLPLIRKQRILMSKISSHPKSSLDIRNEEHTSYLATAFDMWSSFDTSDSDVSYIQVGPGRSYESEFSDFDEQDLINTDIPAGFESEQTKATPASSTIVQIPQCEQGVTIEQEFMGAIHPRVKDGGESKFVLTKGTANLISSDEERQSPIPGGALNSQKTETSREESSKLKVKTAYVLGKNRLLKTSKELMEESKGLQLTLDLAEKPRKMKKKRKHGVERTKVGQVCMVQDRNNAFISEPTYSTQNNKEAKVADVKIISSGEGEKNESESDEFGKRASSETCIDTVYESELKELDALLTELEIYAMN